MDNDLLEKLEAYNISDKKEYYSQAFSRNVGLLTPEEQEKLSSKTVAIPGMGGVGGIHMMTMVRTGIGNFHIADFDVFEPVNINRQYGARVADFGRSKIEVMKEQALCVNPFLDIALFKQGITKENVDAFLDGVDIVVDSLDFFQFDIRRLLFKKAADKGIHVVTAGPMGFSSAMLVFKPGGMGFDEYFNISDNMTDQEKYLAFAIGLAPRPTHIKYMDLEQVDLDSKAGPSLGLACQICSGMAATEVVKVLLNKGKIKAVPHYVQYDPYLQKLIKGKVFMGNKNPLQKLKLAFIHKMLEKKKKILPPKIPIPPVPDNLDRKIPEEVLNYIVNMGTQAPSGDNCQPWKFTWNGHSLSLIKDPDRSGFFYDVNQESTYITFGALIENISIASSHFQLKTVVSLFPEGYDSDLIADLTFQIDNIEEDPLFPYILSRCVNREFYNKKGIDQKIVKALRNEVNHSSDAELIWIDNEKDKKIFQKIGYGADRVLFEDKRLHGCLFQWINFKSGRKKDGMDIDVLGLDFIQRLIFPLMGDWKNMKRMNKLGASRMAGYNSIRLLKSSPAYSLITIKDRTPESYIKGGRRMERFWIRANALGLSVQPMAGFVFLLNHLAADGGSKFKPEHQNLIRNFKISLDDFHSTNNKQNYIMFFRTGFSGGKRSMRTPRKTHFV